MTTRLAADIFPPDTVTPEWEALGRADDTRRWLLDRDLHHFVFASVDIFDASTGTETVTEAGIHEERVRIAKYWAPAPWTGHPFGYTWRVAILTATGEIVQSGPAEIVYLPDEETP